MVDVVFPTLDEEMPDAVGVVATWFAADGDVVDEGQLLAEVQVAKISGEVTAPVGGRLVRKVGEGEVVAQGTVIARIT